MRGPRAAVAAIFVTLFVGAVPALAQDASSSVTFDGLGFDFDRLLGASVNVTQVSGQPTDVEQPFGPEPPHLAFTLYGPRSVESRAPRVGAAPGVVRFYRTADLAGYDQASQQVEALTTLLAERPDLAGSMQVAPDGSGDVLPYLPIVPAAQVLRARAQYIDTPELAGVAYVTAYRQDVSPFAAGDFWYTFQGLSADGAWYVAVDFVVDASGFPAKVTAKDAKRIDKPARYTEYLSESVTHLNEAADDAFSPALSSIDALVRSIHIDAVATEG
jgi:hypothetical protein